jgi:4-amino-4-deoxy-L-arabinose transferase-like glycosyltransferase
LWVLAYVGSFLPFFYFKSGIIDPWFNYFIFMGIYFSAKKYLFPDTYKIKDIFLSGVFIGLAVLTKGPVGALLYGITVGLYLVINKFKNFPSIKEIGLFTLGLISFGSIWFIEELINGRLNIIIDFIVYQIRLFKTQDAGHGGPFYYHFIVLLFGVFSASAYAFFAFFKEKNENPTLPLQLFKRWMFILFWVVLVLFSIVKTKIVHYSSMAYFPVTFLGAAYAYHLIVSENRFSKYFKALYLFIATVIGLALTLLPLVALNKQALIDSGIIKDVFAAENLKADVHWSGVEAVIGLIFLVGNYWLIYNKSMPVTKKIMASFLLTLFTVNIASVIITPKIEGYSQRAAIEFYKSFKGKDVYVYPLGFKSYAHLFYTDKQPQNSLKGQSIDWLLKENIDKPAYFVCKVTKTNAFLSKYPLLEKIGEKNGYVFLKRK